MLEFVHEPVHAFLETLSSGCDTRPRVRLLPTVCSKACSWSQWGSWTRCTPAVSKNPFVRAETYPDICLIQENQERNVSKSDIGVVYHLIEFVSRQLVSHLISSVHNENHGLSKANITSTVLYWVSQRSLWLSIPLMSKIVKLNLFSVTFSTLYPMVGVTSKCCCMTSSLHFLWDD